MTAVGQGKALKQLLGVLGLHIRRALHPYFTRCKRGWTTDLRKLKLAGALLTTVPAFYSPLQAVTHKGTTAHERGSARGQSCCLSPTSPPHYHLHLDCCLHVLTAVAGPCASLQASALVHSSLPLFLNSLGSTGQPPYLTGLAAPTCDMCVPSAGPGWPGSGKGCGWGADAGARPWGCGG